MATLGAASLKKLSGIHHDLHLVVLKAYEFSALEFVITEGLRTKERQAQLVKAGASHTLNSRHLTGHAVDIAPVVEGEVRWDWPLFFQLADAFRRASRNLAVPLEWGGCWARIDNNDTPLETLQARYVDECHTNRRRIILDGPHMQLPWDIYK